jgi:hypothetical protein
LGSLIKFVSFTGTDSTGKEVTVRTSLQNITMIASKDDPTMDHIVVAGCGVLWVNEKTNRDLTKFILRNCRLSGE